MGIVHFKTHSLLKNIIGKDLINDDNVAILELIKNSYDAGANLVEVKFKNIKNSEDNSNSKIIIKDDGSGMSLSDINNKWLNIAYSSKKSENAKFGRVMAGNKGVGRFSCDRLGEYLDLYTKTKDENKVHHLKIFWKDFEKDNDINLEIQKIDIHIEDSLDLNKFQEKTGYKNFKFGTILEISKLRTEWIEYSKDKGYNYDKLIKLKEYIEKLINPNQDFEKNKFHIDLIIEDLNEKDFNLNVKKEKDKFNYLTKVVSNSIFEKLFFRTTSVESRISKNGDKIITTLKDKNRIIFEIEEKNIFSDLKDVKIVLYFLNQYAKAYFKKQTGVESVRFGSIHLFVNGFRISPFGEEGNDWLGLELRKGQGRARFMGTRDLKGRIEINDSENIFQIVSNREGLAKNKAYKQLVEGIDSYFYLIFRKLERFVVEGLDWDRIYKKSNDESENADIEEIDKNEVKKFIKEYEKRIQEKDWKYNPEDEIYAETQKDKDQRILKQIISFILTTTKKENILKLYINEELIEDIASENSEKTHDILKDFYKYDTENIFDRKTQNKLKSVKEVVEKIQEKVSSEEKKRKTAEKKAKVEEEKRKKVEEEKKTFETQNIFLKSLHSQSFENIIQSQHHIKTHSNTISNNIKNIMKEFSKDTINLDKIKKEVIKINYLNKQIFSITNIITKGGASDNLERDEIDLIELFYEYLENICNLNISNVRINLETRPSFTFKKEISPYEFSYLIDCFLSNSWKSKAKNIYFKFEEKEDELKILIWDDGLGLEKDATEKTIFEPGISTTKGSGLGLFDVKNILKKSDGKIKVKKNEGSKIIFEISIKK